MNNWFNNYAGRSDKDKELSTELSTAGIKVYSFPGCDFGSEVKTSVFGTLHGWEFKRAWYYWVCKGPGIPTSYAMRLHEAFGKEVRVDGDCGCPSPLQRFKGLGCGIYHVDTQEGLNALAETIRLVVKESGVVEKPEDE